MCHFTRMKIFRVRQFFVVIFLIPGHSPPFPATPPANLTCPINLRYYVIFLYDVSICEGLFGDWAVLWWVLVWMGPCVIGSFCAGLLCDGSFSDGLGPYVGAPSRYPPYFSLSLSSLCEIEIFKYGTCRTPKQAGGTTGGRSIETTEIKKKLDYACANPCMM